MNEEKDFEKVTEKLEKVNEEQRVVPVVELFSETTLSKRFTKFGEIMERVKGNSFEEKLKNLVKPVKTITISNDSERESANRLKINITTARTTIAGAGKVWRKVFRDEIQKEQNYENSILALFSTEEEELRKKIDEFDKNKKRAERMYLLPMRAKMLEAIGVIISDNEVLDFDEDGFAKFYSEKRNEFALLQEQQRQIKIDKKHDERYRFLIEKDLFNYLSNKFQKFGELEDTEFDEIIAECGVNKEKAEIQKQADLEKAMEQTRLAEQQRQERLKQQEKEREQEENRRKEEQIKKEQEAMKKDEKMKIWARQNGYNKETDKLIPNGKEIILWRKISTFIID